MSSAKFAWDAVEGAKGYKIYRSGFSMDVGNVTEYEMHEFEEGVLYRMYVVAYDDNGESPHSNEIIYIGGE